MQTISKIQQHWGSGPDFLNQITGVTETGKRTCGWLKWKNLPEHFPLQGGRGPRQGPATWREGEAGLRRSGQRRPPGTFTSFTLQHSPRRVTSLWQIKSSTLGRLPCSAKGMTAAAGRVGTWGQVAARGQAPAPSEAAGTWRAPAPRCPHRQLSRWTGSRPCLQLLWPQVSVGAPLLSYLPEGWNSPHLWFFLPDTQSPTSPPHWLSSDPHQPRMHFPGPWGSDSPSMVRAHLGSGLLKEKSMNKPHT